MFRISGRNLAILACAGGELWYGQGRGSHTDTHTQAQATTIPEGQNCPGIKIVCIRAIITGKSTVHSTACSSLRKRKHQDCITGPFREESNNGPVRESCGAEWIHTQRAS